MVVVKKVCECPNCGSSDHMYCCAPVTITYKLYSDGSAKPQGRDYAAAGLGEVTSARCTLCGFEGKIEEFSKKLNESPATGGKLMPEIENEEILQAEDFIERWTALDSQGQIELLKQVKLPHEVIKQVWDQLGDENNQFRFLCCKHQTLESEFLREQWETFEVDSRYAAVMSQENIPADLVEGFWKEICATGDQKVIDAFAETVPPKRRPKGVKEDR